MPLDGLSVHVLCREMNQTLVNGRLFRIFQPWPDVVSLHFRVQQNDRVLLLSAMPQLPSVHITKNVPPNPLEPPAFCMALRKYLQPARLLRVEQIGCDRIVRFIFETFDEHGRRIERILLLQLTGRSSNIVLMADDEKHIIDALHRGRRFMPGAEFEMPVASKKMNPFSLSQDELFELIRLAPADKQLQKVFRDELDGFGPFAGKQLLRTANMAENITRSELSVTEMEHLAKAAYTFLQAVHAGRTSPTVFQTSSSIDAWLAPPQTPDVKHIRSTHSLHDAMDYVFTMHNEQQRREHIQRRLLRVIRQSLARAERKLDERLKERQAAAEADTYRHYGDLLTAYMHEIQPHTDEITVRDYTADYTPITIALDPHISPAENVQRYYTQYRRAQRAAKALQRLVQSAEQEVAYYNNVLTAIELAETEAELHDIEEELVQQGIVRPKSRKRKGRSEAMSKPLRFQSTDGHTIYVGRNNRQNDELTLRRARPHDLWFHTKDIPGSHVILRSDTPPSSGALNEAAVIAAYYSKSRQSSNVPVDWVACKHVRKPKGAPPGFVIYDHHETLFVTPDESLVKKLAIKEK